uniref:Transmembrane protein n=1 Tax=Romanomermis culicivorax TaxID=13658 RepID=A0A915I8R7_ROMCU
MKLFLQIHHPIRLQPSPSPPRYFTASRIRNNGVLLDAAFWVTGIVFKILPCLCLTVFIVVLIYILAGVKRRRERLRRNACDQNQRADKTTFMLIVLLTVFLISESPQGLLLILSVFFTTFHPFSNDRCSGRSFGKCSVTRAILDNLEVVE